MKYIELVKGLFTNKHEARAKQEEPYIAYSKEAGRLMFNLIPEPIVLPPDNEIWYTSSDGNVVSPYKTDVFGANIVSNTYEDGKGIILFDAPVLEVGTLAFLEKTTLSSIVIPKTVINVSKTAFDGCTNLSSVIWCVPNHADYTSSYLPTDKYNKYRYGPFLLISDNITTFIISNDVVHIPAYLCESMSNLTSITIPNSVTSIGNSAFKGCSSLTSIEIPSSVQNIAYTVFNNCSNLSYILWDVESLTDYTSTLVNGVTRYYSPFENISLDVIIEFGPNVKYIPQYLCINMTSLKSVTIPSNVEIIGNSAFQGVNLNTVVLENGVQSIGKLCFYNIININIPKSVKSLLYSSFYGSKTESISVSPENPIYDSRDNCNAIIETNSDTLIKACKNTVIPNTVKILGKYAFLDTQLNSLIIPEGVLEIGDYCFTNQRNLSHILIPSTLNKFGYMCFNSCYVTADNIINNSSLDLSSTTITIVDYEQEDGLMVKGSNAYCRKWATNVSIPKDVTTLDKFNQCNITSITIPINVTYVSYDCFLGCEKLQEVIYEGTTEQCQLVTNLISSYTFKNSLMTHIVCTDGIITL